MKITDICSAGIDRSSNSISWSPSPAGWIYRIYWICWVSLIIWIPSSLFIHTTGIYQYITNTIPEECTGCPTKHDSSKTTWRASLILELISCIFCKPNLRSKILESQNNRSLGIPKLWSFYFLLSIFPKKWIILFRFWQFWFLFNKLKSERNF